MQTVQPVILSGGSGTRLWPLSRGSYPKQFMTLEGDTLFAKTVSRALALPDAKAPVVICNEEHRFLAAAILQEQSRKPGQENAAGAAILLEPVGRNTAPAIALAALHAMQDSDPLLLVLSSDHLINPESAFADAVAAGIAGADAGYLAVFGVTPTRPETGYGYIKEGAMLLPGVFAVESFVEKPDAETAKNMLLQGSFSWNSGMFLFRASAFMNELQNHAPKIYDACLAAWANRKQDPDFTRFSAADLALCPSVSIDYAVMEHTAKACMVPLEAEWSDMGSWKAFYETGDKDENGNVRHGDVIQLESRDCYLHSSHRLVAALGVNNLSVVETADAVLVLPNDRCQDVKLLLENLKQQGRPETDTHLRVYRPWGSYETLALDERFQVKRIIVNPGAALSLQLHHHRAEHWVVVQGTARIRVGEKEMLMTEDQSSYIPLGTKHRLENPGCIPLEIIEIQTGSYLGENDIVRFEDTYGRTD